MMLALRRIAVASRASRAHTVRCMVCADEPAVLMSMLAGHTHRQISGCIVGYGSDAQSTVAPALHD